MTDYINQNIETVTRDDWRSLSWTSIIFGVIVTLATSAMLHVLGIGITATSVDTNSAASDAFYTLGGVGGIWFLASTALSLFIGGFVASTLAYTFTGKRATTYGLGVWALSTIITMAVLVPALVKGAGNTLRAGGTTIERAGGLLGSAGNSALQVGQNVPSGVLDRVQKTLLGNPTGQVDANAVQEVTNLLGQRVIQGDWTPQQREQLNNAVARAANIPADDARRRVDEAQNTINTVLEQAQQRLRQAAEVARQAIAVAAYWTFGAMLIGLLAAILGARYGELSEDELPTFARLRLRHRVDQVR